MALTAYGDTIAQAAEKAREAAASVDFDGRFFRRDIAKDLM